MTVLIGSFRGGGHNTVATIIVPGAGQVGTILRCTNRGGRVDRYEIVVGERTHVVPVADDATNARVEAMEIAQAMARTVR